MPSFGSVGPTPVIWTTGHWQTPLMDVSLKEGTEEWNTLSWIELNTSDEDEAYVRVDLLDSTGAVLQSDLSGTSSGVNTKSITLSDYPTVKAVDIYAKFKLYSKDTVTPIVRQIVAY